MNRDKLRRYFVSLAARLAAAAALTALAGGMAPVPAHAQLAYKAAPASDPATVPQAGFFGGLGGSYTAVNFNNQNIYAQGVSNVYLGSALVASGAAGGPADPFSLSQSTLAPAAQLGYFQHFANSAWLWGAKLTYSYPGATATNQNVVIPQVGAFTSANSSTFTGNVVAQSYQTNISNQIAFMPLIGRSFERSFIYFAAGPTLSQIQSSLNGVIGFADLNGTHADITGTPSNFSSSQWVFGGAASLGATYFFDRFWFLDVSYTFAVMKVPTTSFSGPFSSSDLGYTDTGILSGNYSGQLITQAATVSINRAF